MQQQSSGPVELDIRKVIAQLNLNEERLKDVLKPNCLQTVHSPNPLPSNRHNL